MENGFTQDFEVFYANWMRKGEKFGDFEQESFHWHCIAWYNKFSRKIIKSLAIQPRKKWNSWKWVDTEKCCIAKLSRQSLVTCSRSASAPPY